MFTKVFSLLLVIALLAGCSPLSPQTLVASAPVPGPLVPVGEPEIHDLGPTIETVWNCGSGGGTVVKHPSMSVITNYAVEWEVGGTTGVGLKIGEGVVPGGVDLSASLEGHYVTGFEQGIQQGTGWDLPAEPNTTVVYTLMWREVWQPGYVDVRLADQGVVRVNVRYRTGVQSDIVGKKQQACGESNPQVQPIVTVQSTSVLNGSTDSQKQAEQMCPLIVIEGTIGGLPIKQTTTWAELTAQGTTQEPQSSSLEATCSRKDNRVQLFLGYWERDSRYLAYQGSMTPDEAVALVERNPGQPVIIVPWGGESQEHTEQMCPLIVMEGTVGGLPIKQTITWAELTAQGTTREPQSSSLEAACSRKDNRVQLFLGYWERDPRYLAYRGSMTPDEAISLVRQNPGQPVIIVPWGE